MVVYSVYLARLDRDEEGQMRYFQSKSEAVRVAKQHADLLATDRVDHFPVSVVKLTLVKMAKAELIVHCLNHERFVETREEVAVIPIPQGKKVLDD